ncbi:hypothetical protein DPMN_183566 [Dreissena polymorpha]|uniref:Uncharacterized protein n=1 Tax=Dreissena polymorpha TaxID=45954 RepID=A0A9D4DHA7_DREPO|nr:hypothetical protein DPMN_183566 [Dreissena polymorpha]
MKEDVLLWLYIDFGNHAPHFVISFCIPSLSTCMIQRPKSPHTNDCPAAVTCESSGSRSSGSVKFARSGSSLVRGQGEELVLTAVSDVQLVCCGTHSALVNCKTSKY